MYKDDIDKMFYRLDDDGNAVIFYVADGMEVCSIDENIYPVGSNLGAAYDHPDGIVLTVNHAKKLGIPHEDDA